MGRPCSRWAPRVEQPHEILCGRFAETVSTTARHRAQGAPEAEVQKMAMTPCAPSLGSPC